MYYRGRFDQTALSQLPGEAAAPGDWGRVLNGGARLEPESGWVEHRIPGAQEGHYQVDGLAGIARFPTYALAAEAALRRVLAGPLDLQIAYPAVLAEEASTRRTEHARSNMPGGAPRRTNRTGSPKHLTRPSLQASHARLARARRWVVHEKEIVDTAETERMNQLLLGLVE